VCWHVFCGVFYLYTALSRRPGMLFNTQADLRIYKDKHVLNAIMVHCQIKYMYIWHNGVHGQYYTRT